MSTKSRLKAKRKIVPRSESSELSSGDERENSSSSKSSESDEEIVQKRAKKQKRKHKHHIDHAHDPNVEVQKHRRRHKHRKKETEDCEAELRYEHAHRKCHRKKEMYYESVLDVSVKQEPVDEIDSLHRSHKRHKSPDNYSSHRQRGTDSDSRLERHRRVDLDDHRQPDEDDHRRPDEDDHRHPNYDNHRRPDHDSHKRPVHDDHRRPDQDNHKRLDRRKQEDERPRHRSGNRDSGGHREEEEAQRNGRMRRDRREHAVKEELPEHDHEWGKQAEKKDGSGGGKSAPATEKEKPNFGLSGKLAEETNTFKGVVLKYSEPPEARKPRKRWRLYPFKGEKCLPTLYVHRQSAYLIGRDRKIADLPVDHPSCSKQHAVFQYRLLPYTREDGTTGRRIRPYIIDLESANGTFLNNVKIEPRKYVEVLERDVIKFGFSSREYVLLHEHSKDDDADEDVQEEQTAEPAALP